MKYKIKIKNPIYGLPLTSIDKLNRGQFRILGISERNELPLKYKRLSDDLDQSPVISGRMLYMRLFIKKIL